VPSFTTMIGSDGKYTSYKIRLFTPHGAVEVFRRYKTFCALHNNLLRLCPGVKLPLFPPRQMLALTPAATEDRRRALEEYLQGVIKIVQCCSSAELADFFGVRSQINFQDQISTLKTQVSELQQQQAQMRFAMERWETVLDGYMTYVHRLETRIADLESTAASERSSMHQKNPSFSASPLGHSYRSHADGKDSLSDMQTVLGGLTKQASRYSLSQF
jgi:hypothetical protein